MNRRESLFLALSLILLIVCIILIVVAFSRDDSQSKICLTKECVAVAATLLKRMDQSADPCEDFFKFACGNFLKLHAIPDGSDLFTVDELSEDEISLTMRNRILLSPDEDGEALNKSRIVFRSCNLAADGNKEESKTKLLEVLSKDGIGTWPLLNPEWKDGDDFDLEWRMAMMNVHGVDSLFTFTVEPKDADRRFYFSVSVAPALLDSFCSENETFPYPEDFDDKGYKDILTRVLNLLNVSEDVKNKDLNDIIDFEKKFCDAAKASREIESGFLRSNVTLEDLNAKQSKIDFMKWKRIIFDKLGMASEADEIVVDVYHVEKSIDEINDLLKTTPNRTIANYLIWKFVFRHLGFLSSEFNQIVIDYKSAFEEFDINPMLPRKNVQRWKDCLLYIENIMPMALLPFYSKKVLTEDKMEEMQFLISAIRNSFIELFKEHPALKENDRKVMVKKLEGLKAQLFTLKKEQKYFDEYFSELSLDDLDRSFLKIGMALERFYLRKEFEGISKGVTSHDLEYIVPLTNPFISNAFSAFFGNLVAFFLGEIQSTGVNRNRPKYLNFANMGWLIGHEIGHGFDLSTINGESTEFYPPRNWSAFPEYVIQYATERAQCLIEQYSQYNLTEEGDDKINGTATADENISDNQGMQESFMAYRRYVAEHGKEQALPALNFTNEQVFFIQFGQYWCGIVRPTYYDAGMIHSPRHARVNGVLQNMKPFAEAFNCPEDSPMNPTKKCPPIW